ncbi:hypothetical protein O4G76_13790, partial [Limimaricola sp. G21655-S1]|nr:hypothetical protein [Limimaricola sp. G21655-S1]
MQKTASNGNFEIFSSFGNAVIEGTHSSGQQGGGSLIGFSVRQVVPIYNSFYLVISPDTGSTADFWEYFFSNRVGGEPASQFDLGSFGSSFEKRINADSFAEPDETFFFSVYESNMDFAFNRDPLVQARFSIIDDDGEVDPTVLPFDADPVAEGVSGGSIGVLSLEGLGARVDHQFFVEDERFEIVDAEVKLKPGVVLDFERGSAFAIDVSVVGSGFSHTQRFDVAVSDVNEAATAVRLSSATVKENAAGATVGQLTVTDPDAGDTHSFTVSDDRFEVVNGALKLKSGVSLDHEAGATVPVDVMATDAAGLSLTQRFTLDVQDVIEDVQPPVVEGETGGNPQDTPKGTKGNDVLVGNGGKDKLVGRAGHDDLTGGAGHDKLLGGKGNDTLAGDEGNDKLVGGG